MIIKLITKLLKAKKGLLKHQRLFEKLYLLALEGMNIGVGDNTADSGERVALQFIRSRLQGDKNPVLFDVGANIGSYTRMLLEIFGSEATVYAFEPSANTFARLKANLPKSPNIHLKNIGLGCEDGAITLFTDTEASGLASLYQRKLGHLNIRMDETEVVQINRLETFCRDEQIPHIHFLKLDVEGHELKVLEGAGALLAENRIDFIQFEFGGTHIDSRCFLRDFFHLLSANYDIYRIVKDREIYEVFTIANYLAVRKNR